MKRIFTLCLAMALALCAISALAEDGALTGTQKIVIVGDDWGPAVSKVVLDLGEEIAADSVTPESFAVTENKEGMDWSTFSVGVVSAERTVSAAYVSDASGNRAREGNTQYVTLEMTYDPATGSPYFYDFMGTGMNRYCDPYDLTITLTDESTLATAAGESVSAIEIAPVDLSEAIIPQLEKVDLSGVFEGKYTLHYASYAPDNAQDGAKHPLVIWLHGAGEGGTDPSVVALGNKVTPLFGSAFQNIMGGAYVLLPQADGYWLQYNAEDENQWGENPGVPSIYTEDLKALIDEYVAANPAIDTNRIYIGGCSNGGYMTVNMVLQYPDFFAAAYPICEAYKDSGISNEQLASIKDVPIWFVYSKDDTTVNPVVYEIPTIARLKGIGANVHSTVLEHVYDTTGRFDDEEGNPYTYMGHWSWVYFFNNECVDDETGVNLWQWMAAQVKGGAPATQTPVLTGYEWGPAVNKVILNLGVAIDPASVSAEAFNVAQIGESLDWTTFSASASRAARVVTDAYTSDETGAKTQEASSFVTLEMAVSPATGYYFYDFMGTGHNRVPNIFDLSISLNSALKTADGEEITALTVAPVDQSAILIPSVEGVETGSFTQEDVTINYTFKAPDNADDGEKHPLVIWLHGAGEGGPDPYVVLLGNEVTGLYSDEFQAAMGGAYVLTPQAPTAWMNYNVPGDQTSGSMFTTTVKALIDQVVAENDNIDADRIYIGGCSNGGYMTLEMIINYPDYFAAAYPICEAYFNDTLTDEYVERIKDVPVWFIHSMSDTTVNPENTSLPAIERLEAVGGNVHHSIFEKVLDTSGQYFAADGESPYEYMGHWSWIYFFNGECKDDATGEDMWTWMAAQHR